MNVIIVVFLGAWAAYFGLIALLPIHYDSIELESAFLVQLIYVFGTVASILTIEAAGHLMTNSQRLEDCMARPLERRQLNRIVLTGLIASALGVASLIYVRIAVQGIDYTRGLAVARQLWRAEGEEREGISSLFSIPGYGLGFFFYASTFLGHLHWEHLTPRIRRLLVLASVAFVAIHSVLTGGRTVLLLLIISVLSAATVRRTRGEISFPGKFWRNTILGIAVIFGSLTYVLYIFSERAAANGISPEVYASSVLHGLGASPTQAMHTISSYPEPIAAALNLGVIAGAYVTHSIGTVASVMEYTSHPGTATFIGAAALLTRLGILPPATESWVLSGSFLSLPGAFWYDYGISGVVLAALITGAALYAANRFIRRGGGGMITGFLAMALTTSILSPLVLAPDSLAFPFMLLGYIGLAAYSYALFGPRNWLQVGAECTAVRSDCAPSPDYVVRK